MNQKRHTVNDVNIIVMVKFTMIKYVIVGPFLTPPLQNLIRHH